ANHHSANPPEAETPRRDEHRAGLRFSQDRGDLVIDYWLTTLALGLVFASLAMSYTLAAGSIGMLSMLHAAFFGIGAYTYAIIGTEIGDGMFFLPAMLLAFVIAGAVGFILCLI